jgi:hypothetical protein
MTPGHPHRRRPAGGRTLAGLRPACVAVMAAVALIAFGVPSHAYAASGLSRITEALTGHNTGQLSAQRVCPPATPTRSTCDAQILVTGNGSPVHPRLARPAYPARTAGQRTVSNAARSAALAHLTGPAGTPEPQPGTPAYMQQAYDLSYLSQTGGVNDTVAIVDAYNAPNAEADLAAYRAFFGLPPCTTQNGCFRKVDQNGGQSFPSQAPGWAAETSLDIDAVSAICPRCNIVLVEANSAGNLDLSVAQTTAAALGAKQITDSWGDPTTLPIPGTFIFPGVATVAASGDQGFLGLLNNQYPAAMPGVTAAGGTMLVPASTSGTANARGFTEQAWSSAGSGCDLLSPKPSWQSDSGCIGRSYSDLSVNANPQTGLAVYDSADGGWLVMGGTSEAAPLIAAYYAVTGASAATPEWVYQHSAQLNAPVGGSNGACPIAIAYICGGALGYTGPTGAGSISGAVTPGGPGIGGPGTNGSYTQSAGATSAQVQAGIYPNGSDTAYVWQYGTTTSYGQATAAAVAGSGQAPLTVSSKLSELLPGTTYHYRLAASNAFGTTYGYDFTVKTSGSRAASGAQTTRLTSVRVTGPRTAKLRGMVRVSAGSTPYHFVYGRGRSYRHSTASKTAWGSATASVAGTLSGLAPRTTYHVRLVVGSGNGLSYSAPRTFTTGKRSHGRPAHGRARRH